MSNDLNAMVSSTATDLLIEAGMHLQAGKKIVVFVEGDSDRRLYSNLFQDGVLVLPANSYSNVERIIQSFDKITDKAAYPLILGIVDRDYRIAAEEVPNSDNLLCTEMRDIECEMINSDAFGNMLNEYSSQKLHTTWPDRDSFKNAALNTAAKVGRVRLYNHVKKSGIDFKQLNFEKFHDFKKHVTDEEKLIQHLRGAQPKGTKVPKNFAEVSAFNAQKKFEKHSTPLRLARGHDVFEIVSTYLKKGFGRSKASHDVDTLESALRIGFQPLLTDSPTVQKIFSWFAKNGAQNYIKNFN